MDKELQRQLSVMAEWMGYTSDQIPTVIKRVRFHTSFDALWPVWVKFRDLPYRNELEYDAQLLAYKEKVAYALAWNNTPMAAFDLIVEFIEYLKSDV